DARRVARPGRRARRRANRAHDGRERRASPAATARARDRRGARRLRAAAPLPHALLLPPPLRSLRHRDALPRCARRPDSARAGLGARRAVGAQGAAARRGGRADALSDTLVFIPAWNEEDNLPAVLDDLRGKLDGIDVLVVDVLRRPFADATSGLWAVNAKALPLLAVEFRTGAPEVEALIRVVDAGLRVEEVPVDMAERASGESKLRGGKAVRLVLTVAGT